MEPAPKPIGTVIPTEPCRAADGTDGCLSKHSEQLSPSSREFGQDARMSLQGSFEVLGFSEVLELLERKRQSGRLHVRAGGAAGHIYLRDGRLTGAESGEHTMPASSAEAKARLEELCFEFLQSERGVFEFQPRVAAPWPTQLASSVATVLDEARHRLEEWREIQTVIPSMDVRPRVVEELVPDAVTLTRERWRLIAAIDGRRTVHRFGAHAGHRHL